MNKDFDIIIEPNRVESQYWTDIWKFRELFYFLAWRDVIVRYKQTLIGVAWSLIKPIATMLAFFFVFNKVAKLESGVIPYPLFIFTAILPWQLFSSAIADTSNSLISNANLISKVYFPRFIVPASSLIVCLIDFIISFCLLILMMIFYKVYPDYRIIFLPFYLFLGCMLSLGIGIWFAAMNVTYRDFRFIVPFILQFGLYISPIGYKVSDVPDNWQIVYRLNPLVGIIDGFRWCLLPGQYLEKWDVLYSFIFTIVCFWIGVRKFRSTEKTFVDKI